MAQQVGVLEIMLMANMAKLSQDMSRAERVVGDATGKMERHIASAKNAMNSLGMTVGLAAMTDQLRRATDAYVKLDAQVRINTKSQEQYNAALSDIHRIATTAQADISATSMLYTRLKSTMDGTGVSMKQIGLVTETVTYGLKAYGATSAEAASAALQLSQAMGSGRLGGEEFRAVMEAMPNVMKVLAESMGVPLGQLRELSIAGKITAEEMLKAFGNEQVAERFRQLAMESQTITGAFQVLRNEFMLYIGEAGKTSGVTKTITDSIMLLAENLKLVGQALLLSAAIMVGKYAAAIATTAKTYGTLAIAQGEALAMNVALAESKVAELATTHAQIVATRELAVADLAAANSAAARAAATTELALLGEAQAKVTQRQAAATAELTAATALNASTTVSGATSVGAALRALGVAISTFVVAHPLIALVAAITAVVTAIAQWENITKGAKATFEWFKEAINAMTYAAGSFGISMGNMAMRVGLSWDRMTGKIDAATFVAKLKQLDDLAEEQRVQLAGEISGYHAEQKAAEENAAAQKRINQKAIDDFMKMNMTKSQQRANDIKDQTEAYLKAMLGVEVGSKQHMELVTKFREGLAVINERYDKSDLAAAKKQHAAEEKEYSKHLRNQADDELKAVKEKIDALDAQAKLREKNAEAQYKEEESLRKKIEAAEWELKIIGKTKSEIAELEAIRDGESVAHLEALKATGILDESELIHIQRKIDMLNELKGVREKTAAAQAELAEQKKIEQAEKDRWKMVDDLAHSTFMNITNKGKNAFREIGASIKTYLLEQLYKMTVQKWLINIGLTGMGSMAAGAAQAAGLATGASGLSDIGSMMSTGSTLSSLPSIGTAVSNLGTIIPTFTTMMETGATVMESASAAFAGTASSFAAVAPYAAAALVVANAVGLFGKRGGPQQGQYSQTTRDSFSVSHTSSGGANLDSKALAASALAQVDALYAMAGRQKANVMIDQGYGFDPQGTSPDMKYRKINIEGKQLTSFDDRSVRGDTEGAAKRLANLTSIEIEAIAKAIDSPKLNETIQNLKNNFGELEKSLPAWSIAQASQQALTQSLMTSEEKAAETSKNLKEKFDALGMSMPTSTSGLKSLVDGLDLTTQSGQDTLASLKDLVPAFVAFDQQTQATRDALEQQMDGVAKAIEAMGMTALEKSLSDISAATRAAIEQAAKLSATEEQLAKVRELGAKQAAALLGSEASKAYTGLLTASGKQIEAMQFQLAEAQAAYSTAVSALADDNKISIDQVNEYIQKAGSLDAAAKQYWGELGDAQDAQTQRKKQLLIEMVNAATAVDTIDKQLADARVAAQKESNDAQLAAQKEASDQLAAQKEASDQLSALMAQRLEWQTKLDILQGKTTEQQLDRERQLASITDVTTQSIMRQVFALQDQNATIEAANKAREASIGTAKSAIDDAMKAIQQAIDAEKKSAQGRIDAAKKQLNAANALVSTLESGAKRIRGDSNLEGDMAGARQVIDAALQGAFGGAMPDQAQISDAIDSLSRGMDATAYATEEQSILDRAMMAAKLDTLGSIAGVQKSAAEQAVSALEIQITQLGAHLDMARQQVDAVMGVNQSVLTVVQAINNLGGALAAYKAAAAAPILVPNGNGGTSQIIYEPRISGGGGYAPPSFADGGLHYGGLRLVGENGPELEVTGPSRIYNARQTQDMLSGGNAAAEEIRALRSVLETLLTRIERNTLDTSRGVHGANAAPILVEIAA